MSAEEHSEYAPRPAVLAGSFGATIGAIAVSKIESLRNIVPEPFDFFDHYGTLAPSAFAASCATFVSFGVGDRYNKTTARASVAAGSAFGSALAVFGETNNSEFLVDSGVDITFDWVDIGYGVVGSVAAGYTSIKQR